jgi:hypothetical protein
VGARFSAPVQIGPGVHPAWVSFQGIKQPAHGVDHPPPTSTEVKERVELYLYSPSGLSWSVLGWTLTLPSKGLINMSVLKLSLCFFPQLTLGVLCILATDLQLTFDCSAVVSIWRKYVMWVINSEVWGFNISRALHWKNKKNLTWCLNAIKTCSFSTWMMGRPL